MKLFMLWPAPVSPASASAEIWCGHSGLVCSCGVLSHLAPSLPVCSLLSKELPKEPPSHPARPSEFQPTARAGLRAHSPLHGDIRDDGAPGAGAQAPAVTFAGTLSE
jgi:hypothetical protein